MIFIDQTKKFLVTVQCHYKFKNDIHYEKNFSKLKQTHCFKFIFKETRLSSIL